MVSRRAKKILALAVTGILLQTLPRAVPGPTGGTAAAYLEVSGHASNDETEALSAVCSVAVDMVGSAIDTLSGGLEGMDENERTLFMRFFDPGNTGAADERFAEDVLENYLKIRRRFDSPIRVEFRAESRMCVKRRLYYTDMFQVYVCPAFQGDVTETRRARDLIHEVTHIALKVLDRPYYDPNSSAYADLTPRGSPLAQVPVVGPVIRELERNDTGCHPDAYAWFASSVSAPLGNSQVIAE